MVRNSGVDVTDPGGFTTPEQIFDGELGAENIYFNLFDEVLIDLDDVKIFPKNSISYFFRMNEIKTEGLTKELKKIGLGP